MYFKKTSFIFIAIFISGLSAADYGKTGLAFLKIDTDSRAAAMGGAYTAVASDASAAYWNPAGLASSKHNNLQFTHHKWIGDFSQEYAAVKFNKQEHHISLAVNLFNMPGIEIRGEYPSDDPDGVVDAVNFYTALGYARAFKNNWQAGVSVKYLFEKYYLETASGWAVDLGVRRIGILRGLDWGATLQNIGKMKPLLDESTQLPVLLRTGLAYRLPVDFLQQKPLISADAEYIFDSGTLFRIGTEIPLLKNLDARLGYNVGSGFHRFSAGLGIQFTTFYFDYAFVPDLYGLGVSNRFTMGLFF